MSYCSVFDSSSYGNCLADLSIPELLTLKHSLKYVEVPEAQYNNKEEHNTKCTGNAYEICEKPSTMALVAERRGYEEFHPNNEQWQPEEKPSKLQTLFQISVTALAFLSFGGYLLCLIVQSIKSKGSTYFHNISSTMATTNGIKRIKVYRRSRRSFLPPIDIDQQIIYHSNNPYHYYLKKYPEFN